MQCHSPSGSIPYRPFNSDSYVIYCYMTVLIRAYMIVKLMQCHGLGFLFGLSFAALVPFVGAARDVCPNLQSSPKHIIVGTRHAMNLECNEQPRIKTCGSASIGHFEA
jgi:hypothetical protein